MGQKTNPTGLRLGINRTWDSRWYAEKNYADLLHADIEIRKYLNKKLAAAGISHIVIERPANKVRVTLYCARPGVVIGKKGQDIETLKKELGRMANGRDLSINIVEVRKPEINAKLVADNIAQQLEKRVPSRDEAGRSIGTASGGGRNPD